MDGEKIHIVVLPCPFRGHLNPAVHLAACLASKGLTITFIITEAIHQQVSNSNLNSPDFWLSDQGNSSVHDIRCAIVSDGLPLEFDRSGNIERFFHSLIHDMGSHVEDCIERLVTEDPPASCLIADTFLLWSLAIARKFKLVHVSWWTQSATVFSIYSHIHLLREKGHCSSNDPREDQIDYIPGVDKIDVSDLPSYLQLPHLPTFVHQAVFESFESVKNADLVLCNSVQELEQDTMPALNQSLNIPFLAIGSLHALQDFKRQVGSSFLRESDCIEWLNSKQPGSVIYVSFGSTFDVGPGESKEITKGIILSQCNFVWVHRSGGQNQFADDLLDQLSDRGIIIPWCCQSEVLSHKAISAFLTHCGWNSVLESLWYEVPMLAFPIKTDQFSNRKLIVDDWKVALDLGRRQKVTKEEVAEKINELMHGEMGRELRTQIGMLKREMEKAISPDGSSTRNLQYFINELQFKADKGYRADPSSSEDLK